MFDRMMLTLLPALALAAACRTPGSSDEPRRLAADADVVFTGRALVLRAATFDAAEVDNLAIVRVGRVLSGGSAFAAIAGTDITVQLRDPALTVVGEDRVYYAKGWQSGESPAVIELGNTKVRSEGELTRMQDDIGRFKQERADQELRTRLSTAELVIRGRVTAVRRADLPQEASEHAAEWQEADIQVTTVLRGASELRTVTVMFPGSTDVAWIGWPRFAVGTEAIWLLRPYQYAGIRLARPTARPGDQLAVDQEARVRQLLPR